MEKIYSRRNKGDREHSNAKVSSSRKNQGRDYLESKKVKNTSKSRYIGAQEDNFKGAGRNGSKNSDTRGKLNDNARGKFDSNKGKTSSKRRSMKKTRQ